MMNYNEALDFMYNQLPMFHRIGKAAYKANLDNANALDKLCDFPHRTFRTIHVAGTNGKGSVSHMLASVLQQAGYKTGLFTSPHLLDFRERIRVNGEMISEEAVAVFITKHKEQFDDLKPSFFEMTSALAFQYFKEEGVDVAVIETGLGGRLDSTNIILPELSVITNIGFDHMELLGDTLEKITIEKAGIIKPGVPVVIGESHPKTKPIFEKFASDNNSPILFADKNYLVSNTKSEDPILQKISVKKAGEESETIYRLDLQGLYQQKNICTVLAAIDVLNGSRNFQIKSHEIKTGLKNASKNTGLKGRWQVLSQKPLTICDTGHNEDGIRWVVKQIKQLKYEKLHFVFGVVNDKDISRILPLLPIEAIYYFTKANIPRALDEHELMQKAGLVGLIGKAYASVSLALEAAKNNSKANDLIFIGGSTFVVADALQYERNI